MKNRRLRFIFFALFSLLFGLIFADFGYSWLYLRELLHPACNASVFDPASSPMPIIDTLTTHDGHLLPIYYYPSQNGAAIIINSALGGTGVQIPAQTEFLLAAGYGVLLVESRACIGEAVTLGYKEGLDVPYAAEYLILEGEIEAGKIGVMGFSMGGAAAVIGGARTPAIGAVMHEGNYHNLGGLFVPEDSSISRKLISLPILLLYWAETGANPWSVAPIDAVATLSPRPVLMIYGSEEIENGQGYAQYEAARAPKTLWVVPGGTHGRNYSLFPAEYEMRLLAFFDEYLLK